WSYIGGTCPILCALVGLLSWLFCCCMCLFSICCLSVFFFTDTATTEIYTLSLHDALPICDGRRPRRICERLVARRLPDETNAGRSEEHTSELQSLRHLVCRLLLEKKKKKNSSSDHKEMPTAA